MATYKLRQPVLKAIQFDGDNHEEVAEEMGGFVEDDSILIPTGALDKEGNAVTEELELSEGDWATRDLATGKVEINPEGFPDDYEYVP